MWIPHLEIVAEDRLKLKFGICIYYACFVVEEWEKNAEESQHMDESEILLAKKGPMVAIPCNTGSSATG